MTTAPAVVLRFLEPAVAPIAGRAGQVLVVRPGHPTHTLAVYDPAARCVVRHLGPEADVSRLAALESAGVLEFLTLTDREAAKESLLRAAEEQSVLPHTDPAGRGSLALV